MIKIIVPEWFLFGYAGSAVIPGIIMVSRETSNPDRTRNHELIHFFQQLETFIIGFYILYAVFFIFKGYRNNPFEREAYDNDTNFKYLQYRKPYSWLRKF